MFQGYGILRTLRTRCFQGHSILRTLRITCFKVMAFCVPCYKMFPRLQHFAYLAYNMFQGYVILRTLRTYKMFSMVKSFCVPSCWVGIDNFKTCSQFFSWFLLLLVLTLAHLKKWALNKSLVRVIIVIIYLPFRHIFYLGGLPGEILPNQKSLFV
jgi:lysylphosphatidylglycerol synthetase-like protein (DUF2156 family)